jgi:hypothetical protein
MNNYFELNLPNYEEVRKDFCDSLLRMNSFVSTIDEYVSYFPDRFTFVPTYLFHLGIPCSNFLNKISESYGELVGTSILIHKPGGHIKMSKSPTYKVLFQFPLIPTSCLYWSWLDYSGPESVIELEGSNGIMITIPENELLANRVDSYKQISKPAFVKINSYYSNINLTNDVSINISFTFEDQEKLENDLNNGTISI